MSIFDNPIGQLFLKSLLRRLVGDEKLRWYKTIDWDKECEPINKQCEAG